MPITSGAVIIPTKTRMTLSPPLNQLSKKLAHILIQVGTQMNTDILPYIFLTPFCRYIFQWTSIISYSNQAEFWPSNNYLATAALNQSYSIAIVSWYYIVFPLPIYFLTLHIVSGAYSTYWGWLVFDIGPSSIDTIGPETNSFPPTAHGGG